MEGSLRETTEARREGAQGSSRSGYRVRRDIEDTGPDREGVRLDTREMHPETVARGSSSDVFLVRPWAYNQATTSAPSSIPAPSAIAVEMFSW